MTRSLRSFVFFFSVVALWAGRTRAEQRPPPSAPTPPAAADATLFPIPQLNGSIWERERLLGDLGGSRQWLGEHGVQFDYTLVQIYQGVTDGGDTNQWAINVSTNAVRTLTGEIIDLAATKRIEVQQRLQMRKEELLAQAQQRIQALSARARARFGSLPPLEQKILLRRLSQLPPRSFADIRPRLQAALESKIASGKDTLNAIFQDRISKLNLGDFGNTGQRDQDYLGLWSFETRIDTGKMGLWPGGFIFMRAQGQYGGSINSRSGTLQPSNTDALIPDPGIDEVTVPALYITQFVSEKVAIIAGKLDTTGGDMNEFAHISGDERFIGSSFAFNPVVALLAPYSPLGVGMLVLPNKDLIVSVSAIDGDGVPTRSGFDTVFNGNTSYSGEARLTTHFGGKLGHQLIGGAWGSGKYTKLNQDLNDFVPGNGLSVKTVQNSWAMYYNFDQYFWTRPDAPDRGWGMFGRVGVADERTNPIGQFYSVGFGGKGTCSTRPHDRWGVGYYYMRSSRDLPDALNIGSEQGEEAFYTLALTPAFLITADLQVSHSARKDVDTAVIGGLRATMRF
jgi:porin